MTVKNEALRLFLALTALILTAMLTSPLSEETSSASLDIKGKKVAISKLSAKQLRKNKGYLITSRH